MKKIVLVLVSLVLLTGCSSKITLNHNFTDNIGLVKIDNEKLVSLEKNKESFAVFVSLPQCPTSSDFLKIVSEFLESEKISIYQITNTAIKNTLIDKKVEYYPSVVIYKNGKIVKYLKADSKKDEIYYKDKDEFKKWFTDKIELEK